jgi:glycosyltransferase involved in cell wall biosynthesis
VAGAVVTKPPVVLLSGVRWDFLWQRHQTVATLFARAGYPTVFVETTGLSAPRPSALSKVGARVKKNRHGPAGCGGPLVYPPLVLPPTLGVFRAANRRYFVPRVAHDLERAVGGRPIIVAYPPTRTTLDLISTLDPSLVLYDRADDYEQFPRVPKDIKATERELLARADLVSCTSRPLLEETRRLRPDASLSGPAVDYDRFGVLQEPPPAAPPRTVCFFGDAGRGRVDFGVLRAIASAGFRLRLVGTLDLAERHLTDEPNVEYLGEVFHERLPEALASVDAFVLPYKVNDLTHGISPAKTYECLATGRPVVASPLPALKDLAEHVYIADGPEGFVRALRNLAGTETEERVRARVRLARENSWPVRFGEIEASILGALKDRA